MLDQTCFNRLATHFIIKHLMMLGAKHFSFAQALTRAILASHPGKARNFLFGEPVG